MREAQNIVEDVPGQSSLTAMETQILLTKCIIRSEIKIAHMTNIPHPEHRFQNPGQAMDRAVEVIEQAKLKKREQPILKQSIVPYAELGRVELRISGRFEYLAKAHFPAFSVYGHPFFVLPSSHFVPKSGGGQGFGRGLRAQIP